MSKNPEMADSKTAGKLKLAQDSTLYSIYSIIKVGRMVIVYHLLWERDSKKSDSNILGEGANSQWGESTIFI